MHVLVTGGAGFIGSHIASYHLNRGDTVHVVDNLSTGSRDNIAAMLGNPSFQFDKANILTWRKLGNVIAAVDRIYHMAAIVGVKKVLEDPVAVMDTNMAGTERVLREVHASKNNPHVVVASSSEVYGFNSNSKFSETDDIVLRSGGQLRWCYATTKLADEFLAFAYARKYNMNVIVTRLFNTIGPRQTGQYGMVVPTLIKQAVSNTPITVYGDGSQTRSFCDVRDTVVALYLLASLPAARGEIVNVGNDQEISIRDLAEQISKRADSKAPLKFVPYHEAYGIDFEDISHRRPDISKLHALTDFSPKWTLTQTIDELIQLERAKI